MPTGLFCASAGVPARVVDNDHARHADQARRAVRLAVVLVDAWCVEALREGSAWIDQARVERAVVGRHRVLKRVAIGPEHRLPGQEHMFTAHLA